MDFTLTEYLLAGQIASLLILSLVMLFKKQQVVLSDDRKLDVKIPPVNVEVSTLLPMLIFDEEPDRFELKKIDTGLEFDIYELEDLSQGVVFMIARSRKGDLVPLIPERKL